jgi:myo-inositol-1(or 4)-monophosphatase
MKNLPNDQPDPADLLVLASAVAAAGAELALEKRKEFITRVRTKSTATDVVTAADIAVERQIVDALRAARPDDAILGEESGVSDPAGRSRGRVRWILDPIDGTVNYLYGIPQYAVSLAAEIDGEIVAGVVRNIPTGEEFTAIRGAGAHSGGRRLSGSSVAELSQTLVATGFGYDAERRTYQAMILGSVLGRVRDIRRMGACSLDLCAVAAGTVDAYYERGLGAWDWAAGQLIAREAGVIVSGLHGGPATDQFVLAAPPAIHRELHDVLSDLKADAGP